VESCAEHDVFVSGFKSFGSILTYWRDGFGALRHQQAPLPSGQHELTTLSLQAYDAAATRGGFILGKAVQNSSKVRKKHHE